MQPLNDQRLRTLLRESRSAPDFPPGFQNAVWRRIEQAEASTANSSLEEWLDRTVAWLLRPRWVLAGVAAMLLVGFSIGVLQSGSLANDMAKQHYVAAVSPLTVP